MNGILRRVAASAAVLALLILPACSPSDSPSASADGGGSTINVTLQEWAVVVDEGSLPQLETVLQGIREPMVLLFPGVEDVGQLAARLPQQLLPLPARSCSSRFCAFLLASVWAERFPWRSR